MYDHEGTIPARLLNLLELFVNGVVNLTEFSIPHHHQGYSKSMAKQPVKRGRPKHTKEEKNQILASILSATKTTFSKYGSQGTTVERIIQQAKISRPTFYKYFSNAFDPLDQVIDAANKDLVKKTMEAFSTVDSPDAISPIIDAFLSWGAQEKKMLPALYQELLLTGTPAEKHRKKTIKKLYELACPLFDALGRTAPSKAVFDATLLAIEKIGYYLLLNPSQANEDECRATMLKIMTASFGNQEDWIAAANNPELFP